MNYDKIIFDFDDTIWARNYKLSPDSLQTSIENVKFINDYLGDKACIISGNSYRSIEDKLKLVFNDIKDFKVDIWADANSTLYRNGYKVDFVDSLSIDKYAEELKEFLKDNYDIDVTLPGYVNIPNVKIKPLNELERTLLVDLLNNYVLDIIDAKDDCKAIKAGKTTVDIISKNNDKVAVFEYLNLKDIKTLYIGDEIDKGNDFKIARMCTDCLRVSGVNDTRTALKLIERGL